MWNSDVQLARLRMNELILSVDMRSESEELSFDGKQDTGSLVSSGRISKCAIKTSLIILVGNLVLVFQQPID